MIVFGIPGYMFLPMWIFLIPSFYSSDRLVPTIPEELNNDDQNLVDYSAPFRVQRKKLPKMVIQWWFILPTTNIAFENRPKPKRKGECLPTTNFQGFRLVSGRVDGKSKIISKRHPVAVKWQFLQHARDLMGRTLWRQATRGDQIDLFLYDSGNS